MNDTTLLPDDPKLTAYALGELEGDERASVEAALRLNPALRSAVEEIRATAAQLEAVLAREADLTAGAEARAEADASPVSKLLPLELELYPKGRKGRKGMLLKFPQVYFLVGGMAAAGFAVMLAWRTPKTPPVAGSTSAITVAETKKGYVEMAALVPATDVGVVAPGVEAKAVETVARVDTPVRAKDLSLLGQTQSVVVAQPEGLAAGRLVLGGTTSVAPAAPAAEPTKVSGSAPGAVGQAGVAAKHEVLSLSPFKISVDRLTAGYATTAAVTTGTENSAQKQSGAIMSGSGLTPGVTEQVFLAAPRGRAPVGAQVGANTENYAYMPDNEFVKVTQNAFSTFAAEADTASYSNIRRMLGARQRPPRDAVRIEELLNYFPYRYPAPVAKSDAPFAASLEVAEAPWAPTHRLVRIGLKGREVTTAERPAANLVFLLDVSGSMSAPNRLPLVKESMRLLLGKLRADDRVAIVTYAGQSGLALPSTPVAQSSEIMAALDSLSPGGSTNGSMGIHLAYDIAKANRVEGGINRVILCTDGDFNVGVTSEGELVRLIEEKAKSGVFLTVLGFGMGNLKDSTLEKLADKGNGNYGYIDTRKEAEKLLVQQVNGTLVTIAKDVKIQVEFNPSQVESYRLIGYENRMLKREDFANDKVDAGEIGAGHTVTALYEIVPVAAKGVAKQADVEERRYQFYGGVTGDNTLPGRVDPRGKEMLMVKVRYKKPDGLLSSRADFSLTDGGGRFASASPDFKFAAAVAGFGMILRESPHKGTTTMANVVEWAEAGAAEDPGGYRSEFIEMARQAEWLEQR